MFEGKSCDGDCDGDGDDCSIVEVVGGGEVGNDDLKFLAYLTMEVEVVVVKVTVIKLCRISCVDSEVRMAI